MTNKNLLSDSLEKRKIPTKEMVANKFMSLQWKIVLATTALLFIVFSVNLGLGIYEIKTSYNEDKELFVQNVKESFFENLKTEASMLESYTSFLSLDSEYIKYIREKDYDLVSSVIDKYWWELELDYDITSLSLYKNNELKVHKGYVSPPDYLIDKVKETENPQWVIYCQKFCALFKGVPYLSADDSEGLSILVISKNLSSSVINLKNKFDASFIILRHSSNSSEKLNEWPISVESASLSMSQDIYKKSLDHLSKSKNFNEFLLEEKTDFKVGDTHQFFTVFEMPHSADSNSYFMALNDITGQKEKESEIIIKNITLGLITFIIIELMLLMIMWLPLKALKSLSNSLPLIANSDYKNARMNIKKSINKTEFGFKLYYDETDALNINALAVCNQLESYAKELHSRADELGFLAYNDTLTELYNRRKFQEELERQIKIAKRSNSSGAVLMFDLDNFKDVNDGSGHHVGDEMLKQIAYKLKDICRKNDIVSRMGGDEFAIILTNIDEEDAIKVADKICRQVSDIEVLGKNMIHKASASIGVAMFPDVAEDLDTIIYYSDIAMYKAKELGRNTVYLFKENDKDMETINQRVYWSEKVKEPMTNEFLKIVCQPIYCYKTKSISHYEALLRVKDSNGDFISPFNYINAAEKSGNISKVDKWVINEVSKYISIMMKENINKKISINLSALSFSNDNLVEEIEEIFIKNDVNPRMLIFEITETAALRNIYDTIKIMEDIRKLGCDFALDDFGVGFSSFYNLKKLPVSYVKIDGSFIKNLKNDKGDQILVESLVYVAKEYGEKTIAEFVEDDETLALLEKLGVDFAQGYYISKPMEMEDVFEMEKYSYKS